MKDQFANYVVQKVLETCNDQQREHILARIKVHLNALKKYTYGKHIVARVEKLVAAGGMDSYLFTPWIRFIVYTAFWFLILCSVLAKPHCIDWFKEGWNEIESRVNGWVWEWLLVSYVRSSLDLSFWIYFLC